MLPISDKGDGMRDIADDGSLNLDRLTDDGKHDIECQLPELLTSLASPVAISHRFERARTRAR